MVKKIGLAGIHGRVNLELYQLAKKQGYQVITSSQQNAQRRCEEIFSQDIDIFIDFSSPDLWPVLMSFCKKFSIPLISGTTALPNLKEDLEELGKKIPVVHEKNFSVGIFALKKIVQYLKLFSTDLCVEELHHQYKKDLPSGTALDLCEILNLDPQSVQVTRAGDYVGTHRVKFQFDEQQISIEHEALTRRMFASGALKLAPWLRKKKNGVYTLDQYLNEVTLCPQDTL